MCVWALCELSLYLELCGFRVYHTPKIVFVCVSGRLRGQCGLRLSLSVIFVYVGIEWHEFVCGDCFFFFFDVCVV